MAVKLYEMKKISSGMAAELVGMDRIGFLLRLTDYGVPVNDLDEMNYALMSIMLNQKMEVINTTPCCVERWARSFDLLRALYANVIFLAKFAWKCGPEVNMVLLLCI